MLPAQLTVGCHLCLRGTARIEDNDGQWHRGGQWSFDVKVQLTAAASRGEGAAIEDWLEQSARLGKIRPDRQRYINILVRPKIVKRHSRNE